MTGARGQAMLDEIEAFSSRLPPGDRATVRRLAAAVASTEHPLELDIKWRRPTFALHSDFHHWICGIEVTRKAVVLVFHFGGLLRDPDGRFRVGSSKLGRRLDFASEAEVDEAVVRGFVDQAVERLPYFREHWKALATRRRAHDIR